MMRDILVITAREVTERKLLFVAAALCALIALATPLLPGARNNEPIEVISAASLTLSLLFLLLTPLALGSGIVARELQERRMSFYLSRPVPTLAIWGGKILGVVLISLLLATIVVIIPTMLGSGLLAFGTYAKDTGVSLANWMDPLHGPFTPLMILAMLLLSLAQFWGLALRSRAAWLLLDLLTFTIAIVISWTAIEPFLINQAFRTATAMMDGLAVLVSILVLTGCAIGLQIGRSDLHRTHRSTSIGTALLLLIGIAGFWIWSHQSRAISPEEFEYSGVVDAAPAGPWLAVAGALDPAWNAFHVSYLVNTDTGEEIEITNSMPSFSRSGEIAVLLIREDMDTARLGWIDLNEPRQTHLSKVTMTIGAGQPIGFIPLAISPSGARAAWVEDETLRVHDLRSDRSIFSGRLPEHESAFLSFEGESELFALTRERRDGESPWTIRRVDLNERDWSQTGTIPPGSISQKGSGAPLVFRPARAGIGWSDDPAARELRSIRDGSTISSFGSERGVVLSDGRFVETSGDDTPVLRVLGQDGQVEQTIELPEEGSVSRVTEITPTNLAVSISRDRKTRTPTIFLVDLETSGVRRLDPRYHVAYPAVVDERLILTDRHGLYLLDTETLQAERITGHD